MSNVIQHDTVYLKTPQGEFGVDVEVTRYPATSASIDYTNAGLDIAPPEPASVEIHGATIHQGGTDHNLEDVLSALGCDVEAAYRKLKERLLEQDDE